MMQSETPHNHAVGGDRRSLAIVYGVSGAICLLYAYYTWRSVFNVVWLTWFDQLPLAKKFFDGTLVASDLVTKYGEHGLIGYNVLFLLNAAIFRVNTLFDAYLNVMLVAWVLVLVAKRCYGAVFDHARNGALWILIPILLVLGSVSQQSSGAMETQVRLGLTIPFAYLLWIDSAFKEGGGFRARYLWAALGAILSFFVFGTLYTFSWVPMVIILCYVGFKRGDRIFALFFLFSVLAVCALYLAVFRVFSIPNPSGGVVSGLIRIISHPLDSLNAIGAFLGSAVAGRTLMEDGYVRNSTFFLVNAWVALGVYGAAFGLAIRGANGGRHVVVPIGMMLYSLSVIALVMVGRSNDWVWGTNYWYAVHAKMGYAGALWLIADAWLSGLRAKTGHVEARGRMVAAVCVFSYASILLVFSNAADLRRAPYVNEWYRAMVPTLVDPDSAQVDASGVTPVKIGVEATKAGVAILRQYKLNVYRPDGPAKEPGNSLRSGRIGVGWYQFEDSGAWIGRMATVDLSASADGHFVLHGFVPDNQDGVTLALSIDGNGVMSRRLPKGRFVVEGDARPYSLHRFVLALDRTYVPRSLGLNADERELGILVNDLSFGATGEGVKGGGL